MKITDHKLSEGITLTFRVPEGNMKHPLIILCHGFCGIRNVLLPCFANAFTEAGFATITFDYRGFGESEGETGPSGSSNADRRYYFSYQLGRKAGMY